MPQIILGPTFAQLDGSVRKAAFAFLEKLQADDMTPGLHIEPIAHCADPRIRTGRVNEFWRAVLVKIQGQAADAHYVYLGTYPHDEAIAHAKAAVVRINPKNGIAELIKASEMDPVGGAPSPVPPSPVRPSPTPVKPQPVKPKPDDIDPTTYPLLETQGISLANLIDLGIDEARALSALGAHTDDQLIAIAEQAPAWQGDALLALATGSGLEAVRDTLGLTASTPPAPAATSAGTSDDALLEALKQPASGLDFAFIEDNAELRAAIEDEDFGRWRIFLHPEQKKYALDNRNGSFRLSGGAGTGKTVVLLHRARHLAQDNPQARIVLTTYSRTLAMALRETLLLLDPDAPIAETLGASGIHIAGIDAIARRILSDAEGRQSATEHWAQTLASVLGSRSPYVLPPTPVSRWDAAIDSGGAALPADLRNPAFFIAEYALVVLPGRITTRDDYLKVRRPGRGVSLSRSARSAVWSVIEAYRASSGASASTDWDEKAILAAAHLDERASAGVPRPADHVLVDEGQDLAPTRLMLLRGLVEEGPNDLFIAEDSQQRIYGQRVVLSRYGINIRGRSRRLTLNYRTTAQVLTYAVGVLAGQDWGDMEDDSVPATGYRSARTGPVPREVAVTSITDEYDKTFDVVSAWLDAGYAPETLGILVRTKAVGEKVVHALTELGLSAKFVSDDAATGHGNVLVMTMHRSKGMEFRCVVLFGLSTGEPGWGAGLSSLPEADRADAELRERSLLYVAATRARDELVVLWNGDRPPLLGPC